MRIVVLNKESLVDFVDPVARCLTVYEMCVSVCVCVWYSFHVPHTQPLR